MSRKDGCKDWEYKEERKPMNRTGWGEITFLKLSRKRAGPPSRYDLGMERENCLLRPTFEEKLS